MHPSIHPSIHRFISDIVMSIEKHTNSGRSPGRAGGPACCGHSKLARAHTWLPLTIVQFISVTEVVTKSVTKKRNESLWSWNMDTRSSSVFDVFCWSPFWKWARIDRVRCCRMSINQFIKSEKTKRPLISQYKIHETHLCVCLKGVNGGNAIAM